jgi:hypothetical protein
MAQAMYTSQFELDVMQIYRKDPGGLVKDKTVKI